MKVKHKIYVKLEIFRSIIEKKVVAFGAQYTAFGLFTLLNYPLFYIVWKYYNQIGYESLFLRGSATTLGIFLLLKNYWPNKLKSWLPVYWYFTLLFCLPFFFFFMLFMNGGSAIWLMSSNTVICWLLFIVDLTSCIFIVSLGILLACLTFLSITSNFAFNIFEWWGIILQFIFSFFLAAFFIQKKHQFNEKKLDAMQSLASTLAHEIRTPLASIQASITAVKSYWVDLLAGYKAAKNAQVYISNIRPSQLTLLEKSFDRIQRETQFANTVINMLLANVNLEKLKRHPLELCSASQCVTEALERYPFAGSERDLIQWENTQDFFFRGKAILFIHTLFNLIKNALYHIKSVNKGGIRIRHSFGEHHNQLHFLDTGAGISSEVLPRIFEHFFSNTHHGSGIGLTFCKAVIESFDGTIECYSVEGEYTEFVLKFPKVDDR